MQLPSEKLVELCNMLRYCSMPVALIVKKCENDNEDDYDSHFDDDDQDEDRTIKTMLMMMMIIIIIIISIIITIIILSSGHRLLMVTLVFSGGESQSIPVIHFKGTLKEFKKKACFQVGDIVRTTVRQQYCS